MASRRLVSSSLSCDPEGVDHKRRGPKRWRIAGVWNLSRDQLGRRRRRGRLVMSGRSPVVAVTLVALNPTVFYYGSSLRSHGLAAALIVACCAAFWTVARHGTGVRAAIALVLAILAAHASYHNSYLVLTAGLAGAIACTSARLWKRAVVILGIGAVAGVSMLIYIPPILAYRDVTKIVRIPVSVKSALRAYLRRAAARGRLSARIWVILFVGAVLVLLARLRLEGRLARIPARRL